MDVSCLEEGGTEGESGDVIELPVHTKVGELKKQTALLITAALEALNGCKLFGGPVIPEAFVKLCTTFIETMDLVLDPPCDSAQVVHTIAASGLTEREIAGKIACIEDPNVRERLAMKVKPFITGANKDDIMELFQLTSFDELDDNKGDLFDMDSILQQDSDRFRRQVYYSKSILLRRNKKYTLISAYYATTVELPWFSARALLQSDSDRKNEEEYYVAIGMNSLHRRIAAENPRLIRLQEVDDHKKLLASASQRKDD